MRDYGGALRKLRKYYDYTQQQIADKLNVSSQTVSKWENNTNQMDLDTMREVCEIFGISADAFVKIADGAPLNESVKGAAAEFCEPPQSDAAATVAVAPEKSLGKTPVIIASVLLAIIIAFVTATCIAFIPRTMSAQKIYETVNPSVFFISVDAGSVKKGGTGFFIDDSGTAVTNYHVLANGTSAEVTLFDGSKHKVDKMIGVDIDGDLAVFHVDVPSSEKVKIADSDKVKEGDKVYVIGYPEGFVLGVESSTFTDGIISKAQYNINGVTYIQTNADITHGNSGGVLVNDRGKVIGVTTGKIDIDDISYMNFALPINNVARVKREYSCSLKEFTDAHKEIKITLWDGDDVFWEKRVFAGDRVSAPSAEKTGYDFDGWYTDKNFSIAGELPAVAQNDITLYGKWTAHKYTVKFSAGGGTGTMPDLVAEYGKSYTLPKSTFVNGEMFFVGWECGGVNFADGATVCDLTAEDGAVLEFTAKWAIVDVRVSFDLNGAEGVMPDLNLVKGEACVLPDCTAERNGFKFAGWRYDGAVYPAGSEITGLGGSVHITVSAVWEAISYTIEFVDPYGNDILRNIKAEFGKSVKLPICDYISPIGRPMLYWVCGDKTFDNGDTVVDLAQKDGDVVVLRACCDSMYFRVVFDGNGGYGGYQYGGEDIIGFYSDDPADVENYGWYKTGYYWAGWKCGDRIYRSGEKFDGLSFRNKNYTAVAVWGARTYYIDYTCSVSDDCDGNKRDIFVCDDTGYTVYDPCGGHEGYEFVDISLSGFGNNWQPGDKLDVLGDHTDVHLVINYTPISCKTVIEIEGDDGMHTYADVYRWQYDTDILEEIIEFVNGRNSPISHKTGYHIESCKIHVNGAEYSGDGTKITADKNAEIVVEVMQRANKYELKLDYNYYPSEAETVELAYDEKYTLPTPETRTGYVFDGWKINGTVYAAGAEVSKLTATYMETVKAVGQWSANVYTVVYDGNGGSGTISEKKVAYGTRFTLPTGGFVKDGFDLIAWEYDGTTYPAGSSVSDLSEENGATVTLIAVWGSKYLGRGTAESPYRIGTYEQLYNLSYFVTIGDNAAKNYMLTADIDCEGKPLYPISGNLKADGTYGFMGVFDGRGHVIKNARFERRDTSMGLFGTLRGGTVRDLGIQDYTIDIDIDDGSAVNIAPLAATAANYAKTYQNISYTAVSRVWASGSITLGHGDTVYVGGLIGKFTGGTAEDCFASGTISSDCYAYGYPTIGGFAATAGGLDMSAAKATVTRCYADVAVTVNKHDALSERVCKIGGLVGDIYDLALNSSFAAGGADMSEMGTVHDIGSTVLRGKLVTDDYIFVCEDYTVTVGGETQAAENKYPYKKFDALCSAEFIIDVLEWSAEVWTTVDGGLPILCGFSGGGQA